MKFCNLMVSEVTPEIEYRVNLHCGSLSFIFTYLPIAQRNPTSVENVLIPTVMVTFNI